MSEMILKEKYRQYKLLFSFSEREAQRERESMPEGLQGKVNMRRARTGTVHPGVTINSSPWDCSPWGNN